MNAIHFQQPRGYVEDFLDKFLLHRIASEDKIGLFSPISQTIPILAGLIVPKHPISVKNVSNIAWKQSNNPNVFNAHL